MYQSKYKWYLHPFIIFTFSILAMGTSLFLYIYWYVEVSTGLKGVIQRANLDPGQILAPQTWVVILVLSILVGIILVGIFFIFIYHQKTLQLYRLQRNFINNFTHELKTPVTSLKLYLETFRKYKLSREDQLKYIDYMVHDADRLTGTINRMLNLAKIESKTIKKEFVTGDLVVITKAFLKRNRHIFNKCQIQVHHPSGESFEYPVDLSLFEMLLMNLLTNAIKYNTSKTPRIDITFAPRGRKLHVRFEDNGIGFPQSEIKKIFRKFYQIGRSDDMSAKGSGLGLYLADSIVRLHKGKITAGSNEQGKGAVFSVIFPLNPPAPAHEEIDESF